MKAKTLQAQYHRYMKSRLNTIRVTGLIMCFVIALLLILQYTKLIDGLWNCVSLTYICGFLFTLNSQYQKLCKHKTSVILSNIAAIIFYCATLSLLIMVVLQSYGVIYL